MKVRLNDYEIHRYILSIRVEVEGEVYPVDLSYDVWSGYDLTFLNDQGQKIPYPEWAIKMEQESDDSLGYILEASLGGSLEWFWQILSAGKEVSA